MFISKPSFLHICFLFLVRVNRAFLSNIDNAHVSYVLEFLGAIINPHILYSPPISSKHVLWRQNHICPFALTLCQGVVAPTPPPHKVTLHKVTPHKVGGTRLGKMYEVGFFEVDAVFLCFSCVFSKSSPPDRKVPTAIPHKAPRTRFPPPAPRIAAIQGSGGVTYPRAGQQAKRHEQQSKGQDL